MSNIPGEQESISRLDEEQKTTYNSWHLATRFVFCGQTEKVQGTIMADPDRRWGLMSHVMTLINARKDVPDDECFKGTFDG